MTPKEYRLERIKRKEVMRAKGRHERFASDAAKSEARPRQSHFTTTGEVCDAMRVAHTIVLYLGNSAAHKQFFQRRIDGRRNMIDP